MIPTLHKAAILSVATVVLALLPPPLHSQERSSPANWTEDSNQLGVIEGAVVRAGTNEPLSKARIVLRPENGSPGHSQAAVTGIDGRFSIDGITAGRYDIYVERAGYLSKSFGEDDTGQQSAILAIAAGQRITDMVFRLARCAAISGRVLDDDGEPAQGISVEVLERGRYRGKVSVRSAGRADTNDRGDYRVFDLYPGRYYVRVSPSSGGTTSWPDGFTLDSSILKSLGGYVPTFYGGSLEVSRATAIDLKAGDDIDGVDVSMIRNRSYTVRGAVLNGVTAGPALGAEVVAVRRDDSESSEERQSGTADRKEGLFELKGLVPGSYSIFAQDSQAEDRLAGIEEIEVVNADVNSVRIVINRGVDILGRLSLTGKTTPSKPLTVFLQSMGSEPLVSTGGQAVVKPNGTFVVQDVFDGSYEVGVFSDCNVCYLKSATFNGVDVLDTGFKVASSPGVLELQYSSNSGTVDGVVARDDGLPAVGANVVLVPDAPRRDRTSLYASGTTDQYGRFSMPGVAPGKYKAFAWKKLADSDPEDPEFLRPFEAKGESVSIAENGKQTIQLKLLAGDGGTPEK